MNWMDYLPFFGSLEEEKYEVEERRIYLSADAKNNLENALLPIIEHDNILADIQLIKSRQILFITFYLLSLCYAAMLLFR